MKGSMREFAIIGDLTDVREAVCVEVIEGTIIPLGGVANVTIEFTVGMRKAYLITLHYNNVKCEGRLLGVFKTTQEMCERVGTFDPDNPGEVEE